MIEYTAINIDNNRMNITLDNKYKDIIHNIGYDFKIVNEVWYGQENGMKYPIVIEPEGFKFFKYIDYEVTLEFKSEYDRDFFDYLFGNYCNQVDKLEYNYKELEVTV